MFTHMLALVALDFTYPPLLNGCEIKIFSRMQVGTVHEPMLILELCTAV